MTISWETIVNSSYGSGIVISLDNGKRNEEFRNTGKNWYLAQELQLYERWADFELKTPGLGDLLIVMKEWNDNNFQISVAQFPKGTWEFARLIPRDESTSFSANRNRCPLGCYVKGFADLTEDTKRAHMEFNHE